MSQTMRWRVGVTDFWGEWSKGWGGGVTNLWVRPSVVTVKQAGLWIRQTSVMGVFMAQCMGLCQGLLRVQTWMYMLLPAVNPNLSKLCLMHHGWLIIKCVHIENIYCRFPPSISLQREFCSGSEVEQVNQAPLSPIFQITQLHPQFKS